MLSRRSKQTFYDFAGPLMRLNGWRHRYFSSPQKTIDGRVMIHLGPGQNNYIADWVNVDANMFKCDVWADLRNPLPFPDECADAIYSHHVVEHLPDLKSHFAEVWRVLKNSGVYRVGGPNGDMAIKKFMERDHSWFGDWPEKYESIGGRFVNFVFCRNEHLTLLSESLLQEIAESCGFSTGTVMLPRNQTLHPDLFQACLAKERDEDPLAPRTLIVEFEKRPQFA